MSLFTKVLALGSWRSSISLPSSAQQQLISFCESTCQRSVMSWKKENDLLVKAAVFSNPELRSIAAQVNINSTDHTFQSVDDISCSLNKLDPDSEVNGPLEDLEYHGMGTSLPDDEDELLSGIMDGFRIGYPNQLDDLGEYDDVFGSRGGMEIESGGQKGSSNGMSKVSLSEYGVGNGHYVLPNGVGTVAGEQPCGEHPLRTLFVRNINSNVEDSELSALFELKPSHKRHHKFIEFYDVRASEAALRSLNRIDIAGNA